MSEASTSFYAAPPVPSMDEDLRKLSPAEQSLFAIRMATNPPRTARDCASQLGVTLGTVSQRWARIRTKLGRDPLIGWKQKGEVGFSGADHFDRLRNVAPDTIIKLAEMRLEAILRAITPEKIEKAPLKELTASVRELVNSRQLLKGEPTQILQVNQRENLKRLFPALIKELHRRGVSLEIGGDGPRVVKQVDVQPLETPA